MTAAKFPAVVGIRPEAGPAWSALCDLLDNGPPAPCRTDPAPWTSEAGADRAEAARACAWCHALSACSTFAQLNSEPGGVWGGTDRTPTPTPRREHASR